MVGMARDSYPAIPTIGSLPKVTLPTTALRSLIAHTISAVSMEESRYTLTASLLLLEPTKFRWSARTEPVSRWRRRMRLWKALLLPEASRPLPGAARPLFPTCFHKSDTIEIGESDTTLFMVIGDREYTTRKKAGSFSQLRGCDTPEQHQTRSSCVPWMLSGRFAGLRKFTDQKSSGVKIDLGANALKNQRFDHRNPASRKTRSTVRMPRSKS